MTKKGISVLLYTALPAAVLLIGLFGKDRWYIVATSVLAVVYMLLLNDGIRAAYLLCALFGLSYGGGELCDAAVCGRGIPRIRAGAQRDLPLSEGREGR